MQRYLIDHDEGGTWDLVVQGEVRTVEHVLNNKRRTFTIEEFQLSEDGHRLAQKLTDALIRVRKG